MGNSASPTQSLSLFTFALQFELFPCIPLSTKMRFTTAFAATALAATAFAAPATECSSDDSQHWNKGKGGNHHGRPGRMAKHTGGATMNFPATCTAVVTSVQTATVTDEEAENMADVFRQLIQDYSDELALNALTEDF